MAADFVSDAALEDELSDIGVPSSAGSVHAGDPKHIWETPPPPPSDNRFAGRKPLTFDFAPSSSFSSLSRNPTRGSIVGEDAVRLPTAESKSSSRRLGYQESACKDLHARGGGTLMDRFLDLYYEFQSAEDQLAQPGLKPSQMRHLREYRIHIGKELDKVNKQIKEKEKTEVQGAVKKANKSKSKAKQDRTLSSVLKQVEKQLSKNPAPKPPAGAPPGAPMSGLLSEDLKETILQALEDRDDYVAYQKTKRKAEKAKRKAVQQAVQDRTQRTRDLYINFTSSLVDGGAPAAEGAGGSDDEEEWDPDV